MEKSEDPDQLARSQLIRISIIFNRFYTCNWFHTVFKRVYTFILFKDSEGLAKFFVYYLFFGDK